MNENESLDINENSTVMPNDGDDIEQSSKLCNDRNGIAMNNSTAKVISYSQMLCNDNIVIVESKSSNDTLQSPPMTTTVRGGISGGGNSARAGATLRSLPDDELPQPDTFRRAKDIFESLAKKQNNDDTTNVVVLKKSTSLGRSQSMLALSGRAWCNGVHLTRNHHHSNTACGTAVSGTRTMLPVRYGGENGRTGLTRSNTLPPSKPRYQRSCSTLDKYFRESTSDSGLSESEDDNERHWRLYDRENSGSPISTEAIKKIREHGMCVTFFGGQARIEQVEASDEEDEDISDCDLGVGYLMDYAYDLSRSPGSSSPSLNGYTSSLERNKPKVVNVTSKAPNDGSVAPSPVFSTQDDSENQSSTTVSSDRSGFASPAQWHLNAEELKTSLGEQNVTIVNINNVLRSGSPCGSSGYIYLKYRYASAAENGSSDGRALMNQNRCHGKWRKNPYWIGSYYVIYDFTMKSGQDLEQQHDDDDNDDGVETNGSVTPEI